MRTRVRGMGWAGGGGCGETEERELEKCLRGDGWRDWHCKMHGDIY